MRVLPEDQDDRSTLRSSAFIADEFGIAIVINDASTVLLLRFCQPPQDAMHSPLDLLHCFAF